MIFFFIVFLVVLSVWVMLVVVWLSSVLVVLGCMMLLVVRLFLKSVGGKLVGVLLSDGYLEWLNILKKNGSLIIYLIWLVGLFGCVIYRLRWRLSVFMMKEMVKLRFIEMWFIWELKVVVEVVMVEERCRWGMVVYLLFSDRLIGEIVMLCVLW